MHAALNWAVIVCSVIAFWTLYFFNSVYFVPKYVHPRFRHIQQNKLFHAIIVDESYTIIYSLLIAILCWSSNNVWVWSITPDEVNRPITNFESVIFDIVIGYYTLDTLLPSIYVLRNFNYPVDMISIVHHIASIILAAAFLINEKYAYVAILGFFHGELLHPLLNSTAIRAALLQFVKDDREQKKYYLVSVDKVHIGLKVLWNIGFIYVRYGVGGYIFFQMWLDDDLDIPSIILGVSTLMMIIFFGAIIFDAVQLYGVLKVYREEKDTLVQWKTDQMNRIASVSIDGIASVSIDGMNKEAAELTELTFKTTDKTILLNVRCYRTSY